MSVERKTWASTAMSIPRYPDDITRRVALSRSEPGRRPGAGIRSRRGRHRHRTDRSDVSGVGRVRRRCRGSLPDTFVIKLPAQDDTVRDRVTIGYRSECAFYNAVADRVRVPTPQCFYCEISDDALDYALLLADQAPAGKAIRSRAAASTRRDWP